MIAMLLPPLPILTTLPALKSSLAACHAVLTAPPGSGKTTVVPLALLDEPWLAGKTILILEPRRLAARAAAARMAAILGEPVGATVGYQIRFDRCIGPATRIEVLTEGILTRRLQADASLDKVGLIIFDEFHERSLHADLALALCLDLCQLKEDLRLLVMSATLETGPLATLLGGAPVLCGEGGSHPVQVDYLARQSQGRIGEVTTAGIRRALGETSGDLLVFLPGGGEIREVAERLADEPACAGSMVLPLYGDLAISEQERAILPDPSGRRRIILATSIAETSLTIEGIGCVVDSGWSRLPAFDPGSGLSRLATVRVSKAAADQRAGRAGRLGPGRCLRLWTRNEQHSLAPFHPPEIHSVDLAGLALELALWGVADPGQLRWLDPPRTGPFRQALHLLRALDGLNEAGRITATGRQLAALPVHPRLGHLLLTARSMGQTGLGCDLAALLSERDLMRGNREAATASLALRLDLLADWRQGGDSRARGAGVDPHLCRRIDRTARQWLRMLNDRPGITDPAAIGPLLVSGYPDRVARRRSGQRDRYLLASGKGATLPPADPLATCEYLAVAHLDGGQGDGRIFLAEGLSLDTVRREHGHLLTVREQVDWDDTLARVVAVRRERLGEIVVAEQPLTGVDPETVRAALREGIRRMGFACLPWSREARQFQARILCLRTWRPEEDWPDLGDEALIGDLAWLDPFLTGLDRADQLGRLDLVAIFHTLLGWDRQQLLARLAPVTWTVPSGSAIRLDYRIGETPVLAVRIQELFGLTETPAVCGGTVPLLLHLLSPARRPIQVTSDLAGFWRRGYPEVKKELKGRYPKHFWPDDPLVAEPTRGVKRTGRSA